jgi:hypothetical protein
MSNNTVRAQAAFSFKGETYELDSVIDLDACAGEAGEMPDFHRLLARAAGIDPYSYQYEVLGSHDITFSEPTGVAARCCGDGQFDWARFVLERCEERDWQVVRSLVQPMLGARDLDADPDLKAALLAAYRAGRRD